MVPTQRYISTNSTTQTAHFRASYGASFSTIWNLIQFIHCVRAAAAANMLSTCTIRDQMVAVQNMCKSMNKGNEVEHPADPKGCELQAQWRQDQTQVEVQGA